MLAEGAPEESSENGILRKVRALSDDKLDRGDRDGRNVRDNPAQERNKKSRSVLGGHQVSRGQEDHQHPSDDRNPVFYERTSGHGVAKVDEAQSVTTKAAVRSPR